MEKQVWEFCRDNPRKHRLGVRGRTEIEYERYALKLLRGDFVGAGKAGKRIVEKILNLSHTSRSHTPFASCQ